jgi:His/Glu/Gln/Arg/opine family amino acid ABC transporter permease subunit
MTDASLLVLFSFGDQGWGDELASGVWLTLRLAFCAFFLGLAIGLAGAFGRQSRLDWLCAVIVGYMTVMRGIPEILILFTIYFGGSLALNAFIDMAAISDIGRWAGITAQHRFIDISAFTAGVVALALVSGAYQIAVMHAALIAIPAGQIEAAKAIGLSPWRILWRITLPQMWRYALPSMGNLWQVMLKDTAIVSVISLPELLRMTDVAGRSTQLPFTFFMASAVLYLMLTFVSSQIINRAEAWAWRGMKREP